MRQGRLLQPYTIEIFEQRPINLEDDNIDVYVHFEDGRSYIASFFTLRNVQALMEKNKRTGENRGGLYFWATDLVIVERLDFETLRSSIEDIIAGGYLETVFDGPLPVRSEHPDEDAG
jgi:hypothetical protein